MNKKKQIGRLFFSLAFASASAAHAQTVVFEETWEGATGPFPLVVNAPAGFIANGQSFQADNLWTAEPIFTEGIDVGPHVAISIVENAGDKQLEWNADGADGADNDVAFEAEIGTPFSLEDVANVTLAATIEVRDVGTNGGRDSTFYFGADIDNYFAVQLVTREEVGGEVIEVEWANGGVDADTNFGDGAVIIGGGEVAPGGVYFLEAAFVPGETAITVTVTLTDTADSSVVLTGSHDIPLAEAPAVTDSLDFFMIEGKRRMYHTWRDIELSVETAQSEGEGEGESFTVSYGGPSSATRQIGGSATFSVNASGNTGTLSYQWYEDTPAKAAEMIPGATASTLTLSNLTLDMSGSYYCEVTDDNETVTSPVFTLVVVGTALPAAGLAGLLVAGVMTAVTASIALRRRSA